MAARTVWLVPHTHWDREWYEPFQVFRMRLVGLLDDVLKQAEADPRFAFTLDGQTATIEDYLAIRPEAAPLVRRLTAAGQLALGPWRILADEHLVSGETLVRNLAAGWRSARALGGAMPVGYLPDEFGHAAQLPQLLARAGIADAVVWRGVPAAIGWHAFRWVAPDGSAVRCEYLPGGYGAAAGLFDDGAEGAGPAAALDELAARLGGFYDGGTGGAAAETGAVDARAASDVGELLAPYGTDHTAPIPDLADAAEAIEGYDVRVATLSSYVASRIDDGPLPQWYGELRSHARANLLPGVVSARVGIKAAMARAERLLARYAEPLGALWSDEDATPFLDLAWGKVIESSGHDSVTGCGADAVAEQVLARLAEAAQIGTALRDRALAAIAARVPSGAAVAVNPSPFRRREVVEVAEPDGTPTTAWADVPPLGWAVVEPTPGHEDSASATANLNHEDPVGAAGVPSSRPFSHPHTLGPLSPARSEEPGATDLPTRSLVPVRRGDRWLDNGLLRVDVAGDGSLDLTANGQTLRGVARLVDGGDTGDLYNYCSPGRDAIVDAPQTVAAGDAGSDQRRGRLAVDRSYAWPAAVVADERSAERRTAETTTLVELRAGEPFVRLAVTVDNPCDDHRLRLHVPLARPAKTSYAEGQFAVVERPRTPEGGHGEEPVGTFPASGFVGAGGVVVLLERPTEYELTDSGELALTVLRAVGRISRPGHPWRAEDAGPDVPTPRAQCHGRTTLQLAIAPHGSDWDAAGVVGLAERFAHPLIATTGTCPAGAPTSQAGLRVDGDGVVLTSLRRAPDAGPDDGGARPVPKTPGRLELRCVNESPRATTATISSPDGIVEARDIDLLGRRGEPRPVESGAVHLDLAPWQIATVVVQA